ncbi:basic helix-loop-helix DND-binding domain containing protein [Musa troglodytarum]|uniref:Basic helix-loop-helix DND-binding domain containing protein n=1 Tax=Musa troglodytarum TaxID=320322 RepID=A0A9E7H0H9_9LILI|nr:basic helix-loop-helix DND-binding domain containing protein [Musa troglodytarum]
MESNSIDDYWVDGGGSDAELRCAIESFCDMVPTAGVGIEEAYGVELTSLKKRNCMHKGFSAESCPLAMTCFTFLGYLSRARDDSSTGLRSKACREKMRRDKLNDRFSELSLILDPSRTPKSDKASILSDAARVLVQLKAEAQELKESNDKLQETIKDLKVEKNELRDEKIKLKSDKEKLEQQVKAISMAPSGFMGHPLAYHPAAAPSTFSPHVQAPAKKAAHFPAYPAGMAMWQWLPPAVMDTTQDSKLWPPNA